MSNDRVDPENDFRIDRNRLDEEWIQHPQKYYDWTELLATAIKDRDQLILDR